jgi:hypothetical protein
MVADAAASFVTFCNIMVPAAAQLVAKVSYLLIAVCLLPGCDWSLTKYCVSDQQNLTDLQQLSQGESKAKVDLTQEPAAYLPGYVFLVGSPTAVKRGIGSPSGSHPGVGSFSAWVGVSWQGL